MDLSPRIDLKQHLNLVAVDFVCGGGTIGSPSPAWKTTIEIMREAAMAAPKIG